MNTKKILSVVVLGTAAICLHSILANAQTVPVAKVSSNGAPSAANVLCVYNVNSAISASVCNYYLSKRPGANELGLKIPVDAFNKNETQYEWMADTNFAEYVASPIANYVAIHPELNITHLAIAKDVPITVYSTDPSGNIVEISAESFLEFNSGYNTKLSDISSAGVSYSTAAQSAFSSGCIIPGSHFDPKVCASDASKQGNALYLRFAVSFLTGYSLLDIEKMIDKAQAPAPDLAKDYWLLDFGSDSLGLAGGSDQLGTIGKLASLGIDLNNIYVNSNKGNALNFPHGIVAYGGEGQHQGYPMDWVTKPSVQTAGVDNRAIIDAYESYFGITATAGTHLETGQGKISDAITSSAFGGYAYSNSFSGGVGTVYEPTIAGVVDFSNIFPAYASGKTFAESFMAASGNSPKGIAIGDPLMAISNVPQNLSHQERAPIVYNADQFNGQTITAGVNSPDEPIPVNLAMAVVYDGLIANSNLSGMWKEVSGPAGVSFGSSAPGAIYEHALLPSNNDQASKNANFYTDQVVANFSQSGTYVIDYSVSDGKLKGDAFETITINEINLSDSSLVPDNLEVVPQSPCFSGGSGNMVVSWNTPAAWSPSSGTGNLPNVSNALPAYRVLVDNKPIAKISVGNTKYVQPAMPKSDHIYAVQTVIQAPGTPSSLSKPAAVEAVAPPSCGATSAVLGENQPLPITVSVAGSGTGVVFGNGFGCSSACTEEKNSGEQLTLTETPAVGSVFSGWSGICTGQAASCSFTVANGAKLTANFTASQSAYVAPSVPENLKATLAGNNITVSWDPSMPAASPIDGYRLYRNGEIIQNYAKSPYVDSPLINGSYSYSVAAFDVTGNISKLSNTAQAYFSSAGAIQSPKLVLSSVSPNFGQAGDTVTINGKGFSTGDNGSFNIILWLDQNLTGGGSQWQVLSPDGSTITTTVPGGKSKLAGTTYIIVQTCSSSGCPSEISNDIPFTVGALPVAKNTIQQIPVTLLSLTQGATGPNVVTLQNYLIQGGYLAAGYNTGYYGQLTAAAVARYENAVNYHPVLPPVLTPTPIQTHTPYVTPSYSPSPTYSPVYSPSPVIYTTPTPTPVYSPLPTATPAPAQTVIYSPTPTATPYATPSPSTSPKPTPSVSPKQSNSPSPSASPQALNFNGSMWANIYQAIKNFFNF